MTSGGKRWLAVLALDTALFAASPLHATVKELPIHPACARAVLLDPPVFQHLHTDRPSRQPLLVSDRHFEANELALDLPFRVRIVKADDPERAQAFEFINVVADEHDTLVVTFKFPPEGLVGRATLRRGKGGCAVLDRDIYEK